MKKLTVLLTVIGIVFAVGLVYTAAEGAPVTPDLRIIIADNGAIYSPLAENGVTFVGAAEPGVQCTSEGGMAAGGMGSKIITSYNGVTYFSEARGDECSWARGLNFDYALVHMLTGR